MAGLHDDGVISVLGQTQKTNHTIDTTQKNDPLVIALQSGDQVQFGFDLTDAKITASGDNNLFLELPSGQVVVLQDYLALAETDSPPQIILADGTVVSGGVELLTLGSDLIEPAAGQVSSGGIGEYDDDLGSAIGGVDKLGVLESQFPGAKNNQIEVALEGSSVALPNSDGEGGTDTATVTIVVSGVNDGPVAADDSASTDEDTALIINASDLLSNDSDLDGDTLTIESFTAPASGILVDNGDGTFTYTPDPDYNGTDSFTYTVSDGNGGTATATVNLTIDPVNDAPVAIDNSYSTAEDNSISGNIILNDSGLGVDSDVDGDALSVTSNTDPANGSVSVDPDGTFTYIPDSDFNGTDSFDYIISDGEGGTDTATVTIVVSGVNDGPVAADDSASTDEDTALIINASDLLSNDSDLDGDTLTIESFTAPASGILVDNGDGTFTYTPDPDYNGTDSFTYTVSDGNGGTATATVNLTIDPVNDAPVAIDNSYSTAEDNSISGNIILNDSGLGVDSDVDGDALSVTSNTDPANGSVSVDPDGTFTYIPDSDFNGTDSFDYIISDGEGGTDTATVTIVVSGVNDGPVAADDSASTDEDTALIINASDLLSNDSDLDGDTLTIESFTAPASGILVDNGDGTFTYTPDPDYNGTDSFTYTVSDGNGGTATATVNLTIDPVNDAPVAIDNSYSTAEDNSISGNIILNDSGLGVDSDVDGDALSVTSNTDPANGSVSVDPDGTFTYIPDSDFNGTDSFDYIISDGEGGTDTATVTIVVSGVNDGPVAADDSASTDEDTALIINASDLLSNDSDLDGDTLTIESFTAPASGILVDNGDGTFTYTPDPDYNGTDSFTYTVSDGNGGTATATVNLTIDPVNDAPVAIDNSYSTAEDNSISGNIILNDSGLGVDSDVDGDALSVTSNTDPANGSVSVDPDGTFTYIPDSDFNGTDSFDYIISDGEGGTDTATVTIVVSGVNDGPVAADDSASTDEDTALIINASDLLSNDSDLDGDTLTIESFTAPASGILVDNGDGTFTYTPDPDYNGTDSFTYTVSDGNGGTATATVNLTIDPVNDAPVAIDNSYSTAEDNSISGNIILNDSGLGVDSDVDGDALSVTSNTDPANGSVSVDPDGTFTYIPDSDFNGTDSFDYIISDGEGGTDTATVTIVVSGVNDGPVAADDSASTDEDTALIINASDLLSNDSDLDGDTLTIESFTAPASGILVDNGDGTFTYTPDPDYNGTDSFTYTVSDGNGGTATATVNLTIDPVNDAPVAIDNSYSTAEDNSISGNIILNDSGLGVDSDVDGDALSVTSNTDPANGSVSVDPDGTFTYIPDSDFNGTDSFDYIISDGEGGTDTATVTIVVSGVNDGPVAADDSASTDEDTALIINASDLLSNDSDLDGDTLTIESFTAPASGILVDNGDGTFTYTPDPDYNGTDSFTYTVSDGNGGTATATVNLTIDPVNDAPVAIDNSYSTAEDNSISGNIILNDSGLGVDSDVDGDALSVTSNTDPANGSVSVDPDGTFTYIPDSDFNGTDSFDYIISDGEGGTDTATVTIVVSGVNDGPVAADDSASTDEDTALIINASDLLSNDSDLDGDTLTIESFTAPASGILVDNGDGTFTYTPDPDYNGTDSFTYTVSDGNGGTATATVNLTIDPVNDAPVAIDNSYSTAEDNSISGNIILNDSGLGVDSDVDGDALSVTSNTDPANGSVSVDPDGTFTYIPDSDFNGTDSFDYIISDGEGGTDTATVTIVVSGVNDGPVAADDSASTDEDTALIINASDLLSNDSDLDGDTLTIESFTAPASGILVDNGDGTFTYTPDPDYNGTDSFTYTVSDGNGGTATATVNLTIDPVNDAPVAIDNSYSTAEDNSISGNIILNDSGLGVDSDVDGDALSVTSNTDPANGSVSVDPDGTFTYIPDSDFNGTDSFDYIISDGEGGTDTATVTIVVSGVNDGPVAADDSASTDEDTALIINASDLLSNDSDLDGDTLTIESFTAPASGILVDNGDGTFTYTPDPDYNGTDSFTYTVSDGNGGTATATVNLTIDPVNDAPVAIDNSYSTAEDNSISGNIILNDSGLGVDSDVDGDALSVTSNTDPANGSVSVDPDGTFTYIPDSDFNGTDSFDYIISDGEGGTDTATVTIVVSGVNDGPVAADDSASTDEDTALIINASDLLSNDSDLDGDTLTIESFTAPASGILVDNGDGTFTYTPDPDYNGTDSFTYTVSDGNGGTATATVNLTIDPVNDAPVAIDNSYSTAEDNSISGNIILNDSGLGVDSDVDGDALSVTSNTDPANGSVSVDPDGTFTYIPDSDFNGTDSFDYIISDGEGGTDTATVTIVVSGVNDGPVAADDSASTDEDTALIINASDLLSNDSDLDGDTLTIESFTAPASGILVDNGDGTFTYTPDPDYNGTDSFTYTVSDGNGGTATATVNLTIDPVNDAPVAIDNSYSTAEDNSISGNIILNDSGLGVDSDVDGDALSVTSNTDPANGSVSVDPDGTFTYIPDSDFNGTDSFDYIISDGEGGTDTATVTIVVSGVNDGPVAADDSASTDEDTALIINASDLLSNDSDLDGDTLTIESFTAPASGILVDNGDGTFTYTPDPDYNGTDSFTYTVSDGNGGTATATVNLTIDPVNDAPVAIDNSYSTAEDNSISGNIILNDSGLGVDSDVDGDALSVTSNTDPANGSVSVDPDGTFTYIPDSDFNGTDSFDYIISDGEGGTDTATVTIVVSGVNDGPVAADDSASTDEDTALIINASDLLSNDSDLDGDTLTIESFTAPASGILVDNGDGTFTYTPDPDYNGTDSFTYTVSDGNGGTATATVNLTIDPVNDAPIIDLDSDNSAASSNDYAVTFTEGNSAVHIADTDINITDVDDAYLVSATITITNVEADDLLIVGSLPADITAGAYDSVTGTITLTGSATLADYQQAIRAIQYDNVGDSIGASRTIEVTINDGQNDSNTAVSTVNITTIPTVSIDDVSVQEPDSGTTTMTFTVSIDQVLGSDLTFDYQTVDVSATSGSDYVGIGTTTGTITAGNTSATITVTVNSDTNVFEGDETLTLDLSNFNQTVNFQAGAHLTGSGIQGIGSIGVDNGAPDAIDDAFITTPDTPLVTGDVLANDILVDNAVYDSHDGTSTNGGSVTYNGDGTFTYTPVGGFTGTDTFTYTVIDDDGETDTATVSIVVSDTTVNPPSVTAVPDTSYTENNAATSILEGTALTDMDSGSLSSVVVKIDGYIGSQDVLDYLTAGTSVNASVSVSGSTWELTLTNGADINEYESVLDSLTYENSSDNPSASTRAITVEAYDETYNNLFSSDSGHLSILPVNDAPDVFNNNVYTLESTQDNELGITLPTDADTDESALVITVTSLPSSIGVVTLADGTALTIGQTLTLTELSSLQFDAGVIDGNETFSYTVFDGELTSTGSTSINVGATLSDSATVYESGLSAGTGSGSSEVSGNLFANDGNAGNSIDSIDFGATNTVAVDGVITVNTALGILQVYADNTTSGFSAGDYVYTLTSADSSSADVDEVFTYNFTNGIDYSETLTISVIDDAPVANNVIQDVPESEEQSYNLVLTLDISTSMNALVGTTGQTRFELAKEALDSLGEEYFNQSTQVEITVVLFADGAHNLGTFNNYTDFSTSLVAVQDAGSSNYSNDLLASNGGPGDPAGDTNTTVNDGTSYVDPTALIEHILTQDIATQTPADEVQNISYFLSDGAITRDTGTSLLANGYNEFVNSNAIDSYAVGIGTGLPGDLSDLDYIHNIDSYGRGGGFVDDALIVTDVSQLESELLSTVPTAFGGNITANGSVANVLFGADGGYVESMTTEIGDTQYTFSYDGSTVTVPAALAGTVTVNESTLELGSDDGFAYGTFTFNFADGAYTLSAPNGLAPSVFDFDYSIIDGDGDIASATATINIVDDAPDAKGDLHSLSNFEIAEGNVITALGTDGGPEFGSSLTPFTSQGGGVDRIVDDAVLSEFTYKGETINLELTTSGGPAPTGSSENVLLNSPSVIDGSQFTVTGSAALVFNTTDTGVGVSGGQTDNLDAGELMTVSFDQILMPYGVDNLVLSISDFQDSNSDQVTITVYDVTGATLGTVVQNATDSDTEVVDLSVYSGIGSIDITETGGGWDIQLQNITYDPAPATQVLDQTSGDNGSNLSWVYGYETDIDGNAVYQATVTDSNDGSVFVMRSNGYYQYTPDQGGLVVSAESVSTTSAANVTASDLLLNGFDDTGTSANLLYTTNGVTVEGGSNDDRIDLGEMVSIDFTSKGGNSFGVRNVEFNLTSAGASETVTYIIYALDGTTILGTENSASDPFTILSDDYPQIGRIDFVADNATYVRIAGINYEELVTAPPTAQDPVLVDYVLTDTDGQSDTARLSLFSIDQTLTGSDGIDNISGGSLNDAITGDEGNDTLAGNAGHDSLSGGVGDDMLDGGIGNDYLSGGAGLDILIGGAGQDYLDGGAEDDIVDGGTGNDVVLGGAGDDLVFGGSGDDRLEGGAGDDSLNGGVGNDVLFGDEGEDVLIGGSGDDVLTGGNDADLFNFDNIDSNAVDIITDFNVLEGDVLDLGDLLQGAEEDTLDEYLQFEQGDFDLNGTVDTKILVDHDGGDLFDVTQEIILNDVDLSSGGTVSDQDVIDNLINNNNLITD